MKEWLKSVLNYRIYLKNKTGNPFWTTLYIMCKHTFGAEQLLWSGVCL